MSNPDKSFQNKAFRSQSFSRVYYHIMKGSRYILADERNKKKLLDTVFAVCRENGWGVYAFCVTDDSAYFVTEAGEGDTIRKEIRKASEEFLYQCRDNIFEFSNIKPSMQGTGYRELETTEAVAGYCRMIHCLPLVEGYVKKIEDYWWSSYSTYRGLYDWEEVDCRMFLQFFSLNPDTARKKLLLFHERVNNKNEIKIKK